MANQLQKGVTFVDGNTVNAALLNQLVDQATALEGIISEQGSVVPAASTDQVLLRRGGALVRANVSTLPSGVTSVSTTIDSGASVLSFNVTGGSGATPVFHIGLDNQTGNKVLAAPADGTSNTPTFRALIPADLPVATLNIAANTINWGLGSCFSKQLTGPANFNFANPSDGQTIRVLLSQDVTGGRTVAWPTVRWPGGTNPVMTPGPGRIDIYTFHYFGTLYYGTFEQNFAL